VGQGLANAAGHFDRIGRHFLEGGDRGLDGRPVDGRNGIGVAVGIGESDAEGGGHGRHDAARNVLAVAA
jgi:hypothetical protein